MNYKEAMALVMEAQMFLGLLSTPDARWKSVQEWLRLHPRWKKKVQHYTTLEPAAALVDLKQWICETAAIPEIILASSIKPEMETQATAAIERLQTLYRDRKAEDTKPAAQVGDWVYDDKPIPSAHKSAHDYQQQLKAKKKRRKKTA